MEAKIKVGDTVQLRVGGSLMCVQDLGGDQSTRIECVWHDGARPCCERYPAAGILLVETS